MESRARILDAIRRQRLEQVVLPDERQDWITYANRRKQFRDALESVGGRAVVVSDATQISPELDKIDAWQSASNICSFVPEVCEGTVDLSGVEDPHELATVDWALVPGHFAVAENGAVWITDHQIRHRCILFIAQHVGLVLSANEIVDNMHQAYQRISFDGQGYGLFMSGPSKTADIEQSLVIGAHGARSLTVFLVDTASSA